MVDLPKRRDFADFLDRLSNESVSEDDWSEHVVQHYLDHTLEEFRRNCAGLAFEAGRPFPRTEEHRAQLRSWAKELRLLAAA